MSNHSPLNNKDKISRQRKTTLKWNSNGELTSIDMTRIISRLSKPELTQCDISEEEQDIIN
tara:strand:- start:79 stop:261 length:183 start_codon:yes stop_codon:yes gene_type:complete